jgi:L-fuculose-phosphate aldolase
MNMAHESLRREIIATCIEMNRLGVNQGKSGNVSVRTPEGFLITPSGISYDAMRPDQVVAMDLDGGYVGAFLPSSEWRMHLDIFRHRPEAVAIVHNHSTYATALACLREGIPAFHYMIGVGGGADIRCSGYATFGTEALSVTMIEAMRDRSACLLANHGMICFGSSLENALWRAVEVETLAKQYWIARLAGTPVILPDDEMTGVLARFKSYGKQADELQPGDAPAVEMPVRRDV